MQIIININGPINSGKTTVSEILKQKLTNSFFIEVDDLLSDEEQQKLGLNLHQGWTERLNRLDSIIKSTEVKKYKYIIFAYPMNEANYQRWKKYENAKTLFLNITLAPSLNVCLKNRGKRELDDWEINRIKQMYSENYHNPQNSDLIICNDNQTPEETTAEIIKFLREKFS